MPWGDGNLTVLPVRLDEALRRDVEAHRAWLHARRAHTEDRVSLAEAVRDLITRALGRERVMRERRALRTARPRPVQTELFPTVKS